LGPAPPDERFHDQLGAMVQTGDDGLIAGIGMSNITLDHLLRALEVTETVCVQNLFSSADHMSCPSYTTASGAAPLSCRSTPWGVSPEAQPDIGQQRRDRRGVPSRRQRGKGRAGVAARTGPNESLTASELSLGACG